MYTYIGLEIKLNKGPIKWVTYFLLFVYFHRLDKNEPRTDQKGHFGVVRTMSASMKPTIKVLVYQIKIQ